MIRLRLGFQWSTQVRSDIAKDPEMLDLMAQAGLHALYIGFESVDPKALEEMNKSQSVEEIRFAIRRDPGSERSTCTACSSSASTPTPSRRHAPP